MTKLREYIKKYPSSIVDMFCDLRKLIFESAFDEPRELMWAKIPSYNVGENL